MRQRCVVCLVLIGTFLAGQGLHSSLADGPADKIAAQDKNGDDDRLIARFIDMIQDKEVDLAKRGKACYALAKQGDKAKSGVPVIVGFIEEQLKEADSLFNEDARKKFSVPLCDAISALAEIGPGPRELPLLNQLVSHRLAAGKEDQPSRDSDIALQATLAIGKMESVEAMQALSAITDKDSRYWIRKGALSGLGRIAAKESLSHAKDAFLQLQVVSWTDPRPEVQHEANELMRGINEKKTKK